MNASLLVEQVEVLLSNLRALKDPHEERFQVPHDDIIVSIDTAILLLRLTGDVMVSSNIDT